MMFTLVAFLLAITCQSQLLTWTPDFIQESSSSVTITMDGTKGNQALKDYRPDQIYIHIGVITTSSTSTSDWKYSKFTWGTADAAAKATPGATNKWSYTISGGGGLRAFFGMPASSEKILKIALLFRNADGSRVQRNADGSDMFIPVYDAGLNVRLTDPPSEPKYVSKPETITKNIGESINVTAKSGISADLKLFLNGTQFGSTASNATSISATANITTAGQQMIVAEAKTVTDTRYDTIKFFVYPAVSVQELPAGVRDGINYDLQIIHC